MPIQIPTAQSVELQPLKLPGAPTLSDNGLGAIAQGAGVASQQLREVEIERQRKRDTDMALTAAQRIGDAERENDARLHAMKGSNAHGVYNQAADFWETQPAKISADLENETQRDLFARDVQRRREVSLNHFREYEDKEGSAAVNDAGKASIVNAVNYGAANASNPEAVFKARSDVLDAVGVLNHFNQVTGPEATAAQIDALTKLHSNVIENLAENSPSTAQAYFDKYKDEIAGSVHDALMTKIKGAKDVIAAQRTSDAAWALGKPETEALNYIRANSEGQEREHALALTRQRYADQRAAVAEQEKNGVEAARSRFDDGGYQALTPRDIELLGRVSPGELKQMRSQTPQDRVVTNWDVYYGMLDQASHDPAGFLVATERGMRQYSGDLNQREMDNLTKVRADLANDIPSSILTANALISTYLPQKDNETNVEKQQRGEFQRAASLAIDDESKRLNRKLTQEEMTKIIDHLLINTTVRDPWYWSATTKPRFAMKPEDYNSAWNNIDSDTRAKIEARFREQGYIEGDKPTLNEVARMVDWYTDVTQEKK